MKVLLTGGSGFIGGNLAKKLVNKNYNVRALVRNSSNVNELKQLGVELCYGDLSDSTALRNASEGVEVVYHCAALVSDWGKYEDFYEVNVQGTKNLLDACILSDVTRFIYLSTTDTVWQYEHHLNIDENYPYPKKYKHPYCETKAYSEKLLIEYINRGDLDGGILRPCWVWGPGDKVVLPKLLKLAFENKLFLIGSGNNNISICYVDNLTDTMIKMGEVDILLSKIYFIHDGYRITLYEFLNSIFKKLGVEWTPKSIPYSMAYGLAYACELYSRLSDYKSEPLITRYVVSVLNRNLEYNIYKAYNELNYHPVKSFEDGLTELKLWVESVGGVLALIK